ncbi:unnamed protein product, partial [Prunus brigantina]
MRIMRKGAPLLTLEESILVDKLQKILHMRSPPTRHLGSAGEKVDPHKSTRKSISIAQIAKVANVIDQQWDSDSESYLKHFKSVMILHKDDDALMCKVFAMTLRGAAQDWFHTLPSGSISSFKELVYVFNKEYTSYQTIKKNLDHLYNLRKKSDESLRDYIKRFKAENANIVGCDD